MHFPFFGSWGVRLRYVRSSFLNQFRDFQALSDSISLAVLAILKEAVADGDVELEACCREAHRKSADPLLHGLFSDRSWLGLLSQENTHASSFSHVLHQHMICGQAFTAKSTNISLMLASIDRLDD